MVSVLVMMGPWRFHLHNAWLEVCTRSRRPHCLAEEDTTTRATVLANILQTTATICAREDFAKWAENVGRQNEFHDGFVQILLRLKLLVHTKELTSFQNHHSAADSGALRRVMLWRSRLRYS